MSDIYLQLQRTSPFGNVSHGGAIIFDDLPKIQSEDIQYIPSAGMVMLEKPGTYLVDWSVAGYSSNGVVVGLYTSTPQGITLSDSINSGDHVSGSAIVVVTDASYVMLQLTNQATDDLVFTDVPIAASLVVYANISDGESTGDGGGSVKSKISLPFSSGFGPTCYPSLDANGFLTRASIIGNGQSNDIPINFAVSGGTIIQIPFGVDRSQYLFSFPYNVRLVAASAIFNNRSNLLLNQPTTIISPFVSVATQAIPNTYTFDIIESSQVYPSPGYQMLATPPQYIPPSTILTTYRTDLDVSIPAGTPFVIVGGLINLGLSKQALTEYIYMHGSMIFEIDE